MVKEISGWGRHELSPVRIRIELIYVEDYSDLSGRGCKLNRILSSDVSFHQNFCYCELHRETIAFGMWKGLLNLLGHEHALWLIHGCPSIYKMTVCFGHQTTEIFEINYIFFLLEMSFVPEPLWECEVKESDYRRYMFESYISEHVHLCCYRLLILLAFGWFYSAPLN
jgi:hypothetical protein